MQSAPKPMLCATVDVVPEGAEWVLEPKLDGWRLIAHRLPAMTPRERQIKEQEDGSDSQVRVYARSGNDYTGRAPHIEAALETAFPPDTIVDGELVGRTGWGSVQTAMTRHDFGITAAGESAVEFAIFDVLRVNGTDVRSLPWHERRALLEAANFDDGICPLRLVDTYDSTADAANIAIKTGFEGVVCKRRDSRYAGGRGQAWVKFKPQTTCEARVLGFKDGTGALSGLVGAFEVELLDSLVQTTVKCGTQERHQDATDHPERWLNTIIEIKHHGIMASGKPRHPQFLRRRDDHEANGQQPSARQRQVSQVAQAMTPSRTSGASGRNYAAMGEAKLARCVRELKARQGDAYDRCVNKGGDPEADLQEALNAQTAHAKAASAA